MRFNFQSACHAANTAVAVVITSRDVEGTMGENIRKTQARQ